MNVLTVDYASPVAPELFCKSLKETGFAVLTNHPVSPDIINRAYECWAEFFKSDKKFDYTYQSPSQNGYFPLHQEKSKDRDIADHKEMYHFYPWGNTPPETLEASLVMYQALSSLAGELLAWIEDYLPNHISRELSMPLTEMIDEAPNTVLRIIHYPPLPDNLPEGIERSAAHEDINLITLLPAATAPGLEVKDTNGEWHAVSCDPGNIVVNIADMLQLCTQHYYKSTTHRVVNPEGADRSLSRFSMPLFLHPHEDVCLSKTRTAVEYLHERLREIGIY